MLNPSMSELLKKVDNRYLLVNVTAKRAREIAEQAELHSVRLSEKPVKLALDDIVSGRIVNHRPGDGYQPSQPQPVWEEAAAGRPPEEEEAEPEALSPELIGD